jgi:hypothetical protein
MKFLFPVIRSLAIHSRLRSMLTCIGVEEIAHFDVPVDDPVLVQVCHAPQQLQHEVFDLGGCETRIHVVDEVGHVVLRKGKEGKAGRRG